LLAGMAADTDAAFEAFEAFAVVAAWAGFENPHPTVAASKVPVNNQVIHRLEGAGLRGERPSAKESNKVIALRMLTFKKTQIISQDIQAREYTAHRKPCQRWGALALETRLHRFLFCADASIDSNWALINRVCWRSKTTSSRCMETEPVGPEGSQATA